MRFVAPVTGVLSAWLMGAPCAAAEGLSAVEARSCSNWRDHREVADVHMAELDWLMAYVVGADRPVGAKPGLAATRAQAEAAMDAQCVRDGTMPLRTAALAVTMALAGLR